MIRILAFAGSNSKHSINKQLAIYAAGLIDHVEVDILDLNDFELPLYGIDLEQEEGIPENAHKFIGLIKSADAIVLSLAEHNGAYSTAFKNLFDWMSRIDGKLWSDTPMLLMAASPGGRGGKSVLEMARSRFPHMGGNIISEFSLPLFNTNFSEEGIIDRELDQKLKEAVSLLSNAINK